MRRFFKTRSNRPTVFFTLLIGLWGLFGSDIGHAAGFWEFVTGEETKWLTFNVICQKIGSGNLPNMQKIGIRPYYVSPLYDKNDWNQSQPYNGLIQTNDYHCSFDNYAYSDHAIAFPLSASDMTALERCTVIRYVTKTDIVTDFPTDPAEVGDAITSFYRYDTISLRHLLQKGEDTIHSSKEGIYFVYRLEPAISARIREAPSEYGSNNRVSLKADCDLSKLPDSHKPPYILWGYAVGSGPKRYMPASCREADITFGMQDLEGARPGDNIRIEASSSSDDRHKKIIRFYPELPPVSLSQQTIQPTDSLLRYINGTLIRSLNAGQPERFTTLTCYKSISTRQDGVFNISESDVLFQIKDISPYLSGRQLSVPIPQSKHLKPGTYYITLEGTVGGCTNNPDKNSLMFNAQSLKAMFPCYTMTVNKNTMTLDDLTVTQPKCHNYKGAISFSYTQFAMEHIGSRYEVYEVHEFIDNQWVRSPLFQITSSGNHMKTVFSAVAEAVPPGSHRFAFRQYEIVNGDTSLAAHTEFDGTITPPPAIVWPVTVKHISGTLLTKDGERTTEDGLISVSLQEIENATAPYSISYGTFSQNGTPGMPKPLQGDRLPITQAGRYFLTLLDKNGCGDAVEKEVQVLDHRLGIDIAVQRPISCHQADDGILKAVLSGNIPDNTLDFKWLMDGKVIGSENPLGNVQANTAYQLKVQHRFLPNLTTSADISLQEPDPFRMVYSQTQHIDCFGDRTGSATFLIEGGTPPLTGMWNNFTAGFNLKNVPAGTYDLTVTDQNGCTARYTASINQPAQPLRIVIDSLTHVHYNTDDVLQLGYLDAHATGGTAPGRVLWRTVNMVPLRNLMGGNYKLEVFDAKGCGTDTTVRIETYDRLSASILKTNEISCFNGYNGACALLIRGGNPPFEVRWSNGATGLGLHGVPAGTYEATVTDATQCQVKTSVIFNEPAPIHLSGLRTEMPAYAGYREDTLPAVTLKNGHITAFVNGGTPPYRFNWFYKNENRSVFTDLPLLEDCPAGDYRLTVLDANECLAAFDISLPPVEPLKAKIEILADIRCHGETTGRLMASAEGGTPPYRYTWRNWDHVDRTLPDTACVSDLPAGRYELTVTDSLGVFSTRSVQLDEPEAFKLTVGAVQAASYGGYLDGTAPQRAHDGAVSVLLSGGSGIKRMAWTDEGRRPLRQDSVPGNDPVLLEDVGGGLYRLVAEDANHCVDSLSVTVPQSPALFCTVRQTDSIRCQGGREAMAQAFVTGGEPPYRYGFRYGGTDGFEADGGLKAGLAYTENGLAADATGGAELIFPMLWKMQAGRYTFYVTDRNDVMSRFSFDISEPEVLHGGLRLTPSACDEPEEGRAEALIQGGTPPYTYAWSYNGLNLTDTAPSVTGLGSGRLEVRIQDRNGCPLTLSGRIDKPDPLNVWASATEESYGGSHYGQTAVRRTDGGVHLTVQGGTPPYRYRWEHEEDGGFSIADEGNGRGSTEVDGRGSTDGLDGLDEADSRGKTADGLDGLDEADSRGERAWTVLPADTAADLIGQAAGTYRYAVTDAHACRFEGTAAIVRTPDLTCHIAQTGQIRCAGQADGALEAVVQGGTPPYRYRWTRRQQPLPQGERALSGLPEDTYHLRVTDAKGVVSADSFRLEAPRPLTALVHCAATSGYGARDGHILWQMAGGRPPYTAAWTGESAWLTDTVQWGSQLPDSLPGGRYHLLLTDSSGCRFAQTYTVESPDSLSLSNLRVFHCKGEKAFMEDLYQSEDNGRIRAYLQGGVPPYRIVWRRTAGAGADEAGATDAAKGSANTDDAGAAGAAGADDAGAAGSAGTDDAGATGDTVACFEAMAGNDVGIEDLPAGFYTLQATDAHGYRLNRQFEVELSTAVQAMLTEIQAIQCHGDSGVLAVLADGGKAPYVYRWYRILPEADAGEAADAREDDTQAALQAARREVALPLTSAVSPPLPSGLYRVEIEDVYGVVASDSFFLSQPLPLRLAADLRPWTAETAATAERPDAPSDEAAGPTPSDTLAFIPAGWLHPNPTGGCPPYRYDWAHGDTADRIAYRQGAFYAVTVYDRHGCAVRGEFPFDGQAEFEARISCTQAVSCHGAADGTLSVEILGGQPPYRVLWQHGDTGTLLTHLPAARYELSVMDADGRTCMAAFRLTEPDPLQLRIDPTMPRCTGRRDGWLSATVTGGSYPYRYQWRDGPQTAIFQGVGAGYYHLQVTDRHGCLIRDSLELAEPEPLRPCLSAYQPTCPEEGGRLHADASGGTPPYDFQWRHAHYKGDARQLTAAPTGHYLLSVTDSLQCRADTSISIVNAPALRWQPFETRYLCIGQSTVLQPDFIGGAEEVIGYWTYPDGRFSDSLQAESRQDGLHRLTLVQYGQCLYHDTVRVIRLDDTVSCQFWISTRITKGETATAVDVSYPASDSSRWTLPPEAELLYAEGPYAEFYFRDTGRFDITLTSYRGLCRQTKTTRIEVGSTDGLQQAKRPLDDTPFIDVTAAPNPTSGQTEIRLDMQTATEVEYRLIEAVTGRVCRIGRWQVPEGPSAHILHLPEHSGLYILVLHGGHTTRHLKLIVRQQH